MSRLETEQALAGMAVRDGSVLPLTALAPEDFQGRIERLVWTAVGVLSSEGALPDSITVADWIQEHHDLSCMAEVGRLCRDCPSPANAEHYAAKLRAAVADEALIELAGRMANGTAADRIADAMATLTELSTARRKRGGFIRTYMSRVVDDLEGIASMPTVSTGYIDIDKQLGGFHGGDLIVIAARPAMGKAQPLDEPVLTPSGWVPMGSIKRGDFVCGPDGGARRVTGVFPQGPMKVWKVLFKDGRSVRCSGDHLWQIECSRWAEPRVVECKDIGGLNEVVRFRDRLRVPRFEGVKGGREIIDIPPYLFGAWLGDGDGQGRICGEDSIFESLARVAKWNTLLRDNRRENVRTATITGLRSFLEANGLAGCRANSKFIPERFFLAPREQRVELLRGLLDTDGWVESFGAVMFSSASAELAAGVRRLVWSIGGEASIRVKKTPGQDAFVVNIRVAAPKELFTIHKKRDRCQDSRHITPRIHRVEETPEVAECQCISVDAEDGLYVTTDYIVTHNTAFGVNLIRHAAEKGHVVGMISGEQGGEQIAQRVLALKADTSLARMRRQELSDSDWGRLAPALAVVKDWPILIDDLPRPKLADCIAIARGWKYAHKLELLFVDYLQLVQATGDGFRLQVGEVAQGLKALARELEIPVVVLAQVKREVEQRSIGNGMGRLPHMGDIAESSIIEQAADQILTLYRPAVYADCEKDEGEAWINIAKNRHGPTGLIPLTWRPDSLRFENGERFATRTEQPASTPSPTARTPYAKSYASASSDSRYGT